MTRPQLLEKYRRIWAFLPKPFDWAAAALVSGSIVGTVLEVLGIALLGLLLGELGSAGLAAPHWLPVPLALGGPESPNARIAMILLLCGAVFFFKNMFLAGHAWLEATFAFRLQAWLSQRLIGDSLRLDYEDATQRSPSGYSALLTADLSSLVNHTLLPGLTLLSELVVVAGMFAYLVWTQTVVTLVVSGVILACGFLMAGASRALMSHLSLRRQQLEDSRMRQLQQMFGNMRDVYVYGAARQLEGNLARDMDELAGVYRGYHMMATGPRFLLEFAMVAILLAMIAVGLQTRDRAVLVASVGVFAASGFRLLIGANRIIMGVQSMRFGDSAFQRVTDSVGKLARPSGATTSAPTETKDDWIELRMQGVCYRHAGGEVPIGPVDLSVRRGEMIGIVGPSGVGKSTVLELLSGLRRPMSGEVALLDPTGLRRPVTRPSARIGFVGQSTAVLGASLRDNVAFGLEHDAIPDEAIWDALRLAQMEAFARGLPRQLETPLAEYGASMSGGQLQRIGIARALCRHSSFLLLDEPTSALDPATEAELVRTLRRLTERCGIILVSHRAAPLEQCDRVYALGTDGIRVVRSGALGPTA